MAKVTRLPTAGPDEIFLGGKGILTPFRPTQMKGSSAKSTGPTSESSDMVPAVGTPEYEELHRVKEEPSSAPDPMQPAEDAYEMALTELLSREPSQSKEPITRKPSKPN
jgi:hypothetical protein